MKRSGPDTRGFALISVLIALAILLALLTPFLSSVLNESEVSATVIHEEGNLQGNSGLRDRLLFLTGRGHPSKEGSLNGTPDWDDLSEYFDNLPLPEAFGADPTLLSSSSVADLQRKLHLPTSSPLVLGNLLGLATTLVEDHEPDTETITVAAAEHFPEENGALLVRGERIGYAQREGNVFRGLHRQWSPAPALPADCLVLDYRVVKAITWQFERANRKAFVPYSTVQEVQGIGLGGEGRFTQREMDILLAHCVTFGQNDFAGLWGKPVRVFSGQDPMTQVTRYSIRTKSALGIGGGAVVRISSIEDPSIIEFNFVWSTTKPSGDFPVANLQSNWQINLLFPPSGRFENMEAKVEPLIPVAVNVNTASRDVLVGILQNIVKAPTKNQDHAQQDPQARSRLYGKRVGLQDATAMADQLIALRSAADQDSGLAPFQGIEDLCRRFFLPKGKAANENRDMADSQMLVTLLLNLLYGRSPDAEMGTMPICFASSSLVDYRVSSMKTRPLGLQPRAGLEADRREVRGTASVMPAHRLDTLLYRQRDWLDNIRMTRRSPQWLTFPISVGPVPTWSTGDTPAQIHPALVYAEFHPDAGFGELRYPSQDKGSIRAGTATAPRVRGTNQRGTKVAHEAFYFSQNPDGRDVEKQGPFDMINTGPRGQGGQPRRPRHPDASFPYTTDNEGMPGRHAVSFWFKLKSIGDQCLYDLAAETEHRNRINLRIEAGNLLFEVLDEAGIDPNPKDTQTSPERTAGMWKVPIAEINLQPEIWYHVNISADGNRPDQLSLFLDGVPRKRPAFSTVTTAEVPEYKRPADEVRPGDDKERYPEIQVESTEGFPPQGVIRIGRELFEYTSITGSSFVCRPLDSMGGRKARQGWREFNQLLESNLDQYGRPTVDQSDPMFGDKREERTPPIPSGSTVELYGYAAAIYRNQPMGIGSTTLRDTLGAFAVARAVVKNPVAIEIQGPRYNIRLGRGLDETLKDDILLADPLADEKGKGTELNPKPAEEIMAAFPTSGGYALLLQEHATWMSRDLQVPGQIEVGGIELIKYSGRKGNALTGIERGATIPGTEKFFGSGGGGHYRNGEKRRFVVEWNPQITQQVGEDAKNRIPVRELRAWVLYIVPISLPVANGASLNDPAETETTEWAQIYPGKSREENTEWVRYDVITSEHHLVRARPGPWNAVYRAILGVDRGMVAGDIQQGGGTVSQKLEKDLEFEVPQDDGVKKIGYIDKVEIDWPIAYAARKALRFRGDTQFTGTTPHAQDAGALVLPCHRLELDWGPLGALSARCGRNDRIALVGGSKAQGSSRPTPEWHSINWTCLRLGFDGAQSSNTNPNAAQPELLGMYPFQLVAFKEAVNDIFVGPAARQDFLDTRRVDRVVKFPSGEMPAAYVEAGWFGGAAKSVGDFKNATGVVDEVEAVQKVAEVGLLNVDVSAEAMEIPVRKHRRLYSYGAVGVPNDITQSYPREGGLIQIDNEIIAYTSISDAIFKVAENGRGLLGTEAKPHADCARVQFLTHVPAAILAGDVSASTNQLVVKHLGSLPRFGGTVLMGRELLHYTWTVRDNVMEMPNWYDPELQDPPGVGLFRGRYGTPPQSAASGSPVIWFPTRFWDRYHARSDDPELAYYQVTRRETPVYYTGVRWTEENPEPTFLKLISVANIDGAGSFRDDPEKVMGMFAFEAGTVDDKPNKIGWQGSLFELRFATEYKPGSFDPEQFLSNGWKQAITVKDLVLTYEGQTRILAEEETTK